jgi:DNA processing protein
LIDLAPGPESKTTVGETTVMTRSKHLYVRGNLPTGGIAVVGSRTPPAEAAAFAYAFAWRCRETVISGLALGIDAAAHRGALDAGIPTVAFVGHGFGCTYPPEHRELEERIVAAGGAIATLRPPNAPVTKWSLVERDRLQAENAWAVVMAASELGGGAMHTLRFARELGRPIFVLAPPSDDEAWRGNHDALAKGAIPLPFDVEEAHHIIDAHRT